MVLRGGCSFADVPDSSVSSWFVWGLALRRSEIVWVVWMLHSLPEVPCVGAGYVEHFYVIDLLEVFLGIGVIVIPIDVRSWFRCLARSASWYVSRPALIIALPQQNRYPKQVVASNKMLPESRIYVTVIMRITAGINKTEDAGGWMPKSGSAMRCGESFRRRWPAISNFVAGSVRRFDPSERR